MDAFNFIRFLKNPAQLHQVTYQEINNLIEEYPFCQNLHYLALRKAQYEDHKDFVKKLELAATYSPNRQWLYKQLQDVQVAISDEAVLTEEEIEEPILTMESVGIDLATNAPDLIEDEATEAIPAAPVYYVEAEPEAEEIEEGLIEQTIEIEPIIEEEEIETITNEISGDTPPSDEFMGEGYKEESNSEHFESTNTDNTPSHSISDSDDVPTAIETTDELDVNLENPEDMKLPDYKDRKVIFMEDLVNEVPPLEESLNDAELVENFNNDSTYDFPESIIEEEVEESAAVSDLEEEDSATPDIPFEVYDARGQEEKEEEEEEIATTFDDIPSEAEAPEADPISDEDQELEEELDDDFEEEDELSDENIDFILNGGDRSHLVDNDLQQLDQPANPSDSVEHKPFAAMINDDDKLHSNEEEFDNEEKELEEEDLTEELPESGSPEESKSVGPMPKSAFSSWQKNKKIVVSPLKEKKEKKKKLTKVVEVADLFKKDKKEKKKKKDKKKNSKKKNTKRDAMQSLLEHDDVVSETLAEIVAEQGRKKKAIKMYRRLIEMHPKKEAIYLDRIEELKKMD